MNIYVGNLSSEVNDSELQQLFQEFGRVASVRIIKDRMTGNSRGFGFVKMPSRVEAGAAIAALHGRDVKGNKLTVNEARPRPEDLIGNYRYGAGNSFGNRMGNSFGNSRGNSYGNSRGNSYGDSYGNSYGNGNSRGGNGNSYGNEGQRGREPRRTRKPLSGTRGGGGGWNW